MIYTGRQEKRGPSQKFMILLSLPLLVVLVYYSIIVRKLRIITVTVISIIIRKRYNEVGSIELIQPKINSKIKIQINSRNNI